MDDQGVNAHLEPFAASHLPLILHVARLLTADHAAAEDLAIAGVRTAEAERQHHSGDDALLLRAALTAVARDAQRRDQRSWRASPVGGIKLYDLRPAHPADEVAADPETAVREALRALTFRERAAIALHLAAGMDLASTARALRRPVRTVRRDIDAAVSFLGSAAGVDSAEQTELVRSALQRDPARSPQGTTLLARLEASLATDPPKQQRGRAALVAAAAVGALVIALGSIGLGQLGDSERPVAGQATPPHDADGPSLLEAPATPSGLKLVGFAGIMVTVPSSWSQVAGRCDHVAGGAVVYPGPTRRAPCPGDSSQGSAVSFGYASEMEQPLLNRTMGDMSINRIVVTSMFRHGSDFVQYAALLDADVALAVRSPQRMQVSAVISSISHVPPGFVVVPQCLGLDPDRALTILARGALSGQIYTDSAGSAGLPVHVVSQSPAVGTILPLRSTVRIAVLPR